MTAARYRHWSSNETDDHKNDRGIHEMATMPSDHLLHHQRVFYAKYVYQSGRQSTGDESESVQLLQSQKLCKIYVSQLLAMMRP
jgi:hypothetical protein